MDSALKELDKLQKLTDFRDSSSRLSITPSTSAKGKQTVSIPDALDNLLASLYSVKKKIESGLATEQDLAGIVRSVDERKKEIDDRQKEIHATLGRIGKTLDKKLVTPIPELPSLFHSEEAQAALQRTIGIHLLRTGQFETAATFCAESSADIPQDINDQFQDLHSVLTALRNHNIGPALEWCKKKRDFLAKRDSPLEFNLHRSHYMGLLLESDPPNPRLALQYARTTLGPLYPKYSAEISRLMTCTVFTQKLHDSPYADLASPSLHLDLEPLFAKEYCASIGMSRQLPLRVVGDIGGGGALSRIEKGRKVMRERKTDWSQTDELPIEIPLPAENRYHSIFACPVSKEQSTPNNPPMMMVCGHVVAKDSLTKLAKAQGRVKCPYCPQESQLSNALEVHF